MAKLGLEKSTWVLTHYNGNLTTPRFTKYMQIHTLITRPSNPTHYSHPTYTSRLPILSTYDHRTLKTRLPVRSALFKQRTGGLVVKWVTISESPLLYVFFVFLISCIESFERRHVAITRDVGKKDYKSWVDFFMYTRLSVYHK
jgi:hypothetical protein